MKGDFLLFYENVRLNHMKTIFDKHHVWLYGIMTVIISCLFYGVVIISQRSYLSFPFILLMIVGGIMPLLIAIIWIHLRKRSVVGFLKSSFNFRSLKRIHVVYLVILLMITTLLPVLTTNFVNSTSIWFSTNLSIFLPIGLIFGALEEPGWRGYMQKNMDKKVPPFIGALVVGFFWMLWHIPLFFVKNTYQYHLGLFTTDFWLFNISLVVTAPVYAYLFKISNRNVLVVVMFHGLSNLLRELFVTPIAYHTFIIELILFICVLSIGKDYFFGKTSSHQK